MFAKKNMSDAMSRHWFYNISESVFQKKNTDKIEWTQEQLSNTFNDC